MRHLRPLWCSWTAWTVVLLSAFTALAYWVFPPDEVYEVLNALILAVTVGVAIGFAKGVCASFRLQPWELHSEDTMLIGIFTVKIALVIIFFNLWMFRVTDSIIWHTNLHGAIGRIILVFGLISLLTSAGSIDGKIPRAAYLRSGAVVASALIFVGILLLLGIS